MSLAMNRTPSRPEESGAPWLEHYPAYVPARLEYPDEPVWWLLTEAAEKYPKRTACIYYEQRLTYPELFTLARRCAATLVREGLQPGDRVGLLLPNLPEYLIAAYGIWMAGGVVVSLSPLMCPEEVSAMLEATDCRTLITLDVLTALVYDGERQPERMYVTTLSDRIPRWQRLGYAFLRLKRVGFRGYSSDIDTRPFSELTAEAPGLPPRGFEPLHVDVDSPAFILPTGGTTGHPKAVTLSHRNLLANAWQLSHWTGRQLGSLSFLAILPFFHSYGLSTCVTTGVALAATLIIHHRFQPSLTLKLIEKHKPIGFPTVPAMLHLLNQHLKDQPTDMTSLRWCMSGGASLSAEIADDFLQYSDAQLVEGYGLSEASPVTHSGPLDGTDRRGTIGLPLPDTDARIVDAETGTRTLPPGEVGELIVRGPQVMLGYWNAPEETARVIRDGWLFTGDLATRDEDGFFKIVDRKKDLIITSGFNVYPADVEQVIRQYPGVTDAAVVGVPDAQRGEVVKAVLVFKKDAEFDRTDFDEFLERHLGRQKHPKIVEVLTDDLPRNFLGKVLRRKLRETENSGAMPVVEAAVAAAGE